jgi:hypothetical protein
MDWPFRALLIQNWALSALYLKKIIYHAGFFPINSFLPVWENMNTNIYVNSN